MATRYWVGGTGNWDATSTTNWSATSGGASGASAPTAVDDVIFDANSNTGTSAFTVTLTGTAAAPSLCRDFSTGGAGGALDGVMFFTVASGSNQINIFGSLTFPAINIIWSTGTSIIRMAATSTGKTITTNGNTLSGSLTFDGVGGEWTLGSAYTTSGGIIVTTGSFVTNNYNISGSTGTSGSIIISANSNTKSINLGSSTLTLGTTTPFTNNSTGNLTFNAGTSTIICANATSTFIGGGLTFYNLSYSSTASTSLTLTGANTFNNVTFAARAAAGFGTCSIGANQTINGTLTLGSGTTGVARLMLASNTIGTQRTLICAAIAASVTDIDFRDINLAGAVSLPLTGTRLGNCGGNDATTITFVAGVAKYWNLAAGGNWSAAAWALTSGGAVATTNFPLAQDNIIIQNTGLTAGNTITLNASYNIPTLDFSTRTLAMTFATGTTTPALYGNLTLDSDVTYTGTGVLTFAGRTTQNLTTANKTLTQPITVNSPSGIVELVDSLTLSSTLTIINGTIKLKAGATTTVNVFATSGTNQKFLQSTTPGTQATLSQASGTVDASYLTIQDINATGGATWLAYTDQSNTDAGNVDGWNFGISPVVGGAEYTYTLRSFTQPRRF
jgi:hypothetical protein